jgi:DNA replication protein DnaC
MTLQTTTKTTTTSDLTTRLSSVGMRATAEGLDDLIARATKQHWSPKQIIEEIARSEAEHKAQRNFANRVYWARLGRYKPMADFDWNWPKKIDKDLIESALRGDFVSEAGNIILIGANGLGKTMIAKNIAYNVLLAGHSVLFRNASDLIAELSCDSPTQRRNKLNHYARVALLAIDEVGYLSYDSNAADLLYEVINRRYERGSVLLTTNRAFKEWNEVFPHATAIATMLDRLLHHGEVCLIEGTSYRRRESEAEAQKRKKAKKNDF